MRKDLYCETNQQPDPTLIQQLVDASTAGVNLTIDDLAAFLTECILDSRRNNSVATFEYEKPIEAVTRLSYENAFLFLLGSDSPLQTVSVKRAIEFLQSNRLAEGFAPRQSIGLPVVDLLHDFSGLWYRPLRRPSKMLLNLM